MKIIWLAVLLLFIAACGSACPQGQIFVDGACCIDANANGQCDANEQRAPVLDVEPEERAPPTIVTAPEPTPVPKPESVAVESPAEGSVPMLRQRIADNIKGYSFTYRDVSYKVLGDIVRVQLGKFFRPDGTNAANTIYLNTKTRTAEAYCEGGSTERRVCDANKRGPFPVEYQKYYEKLPVAWIDELSNARVVKVTVDTQMIGSTETDRWDVVDGNREISLWVIAKYGVPVRVTITDGTTVTEHNYVGMFVNTVRAGDMVPHPFERV